MLGVLLDAHCRGVPDLWSYACDVLKLPPVVAHSLLWVYRLHFPNIRLQPGVLNLLVTLEKMKLDVVVLSDGRSSSQRLKLRAVGLQHLPCYLSEEWDSSKPDPLRFQAIVDRWPHRRYVYVGDNPSKDFHAPAQLGWLTLGAEWTPDPVYTSKLLGIDACELQPHAWLNSPQELLGWLH